MMTMRGRRRLSLAMVSSEMMSKIEADQLRMMVWSFSSTSRAALAQLVELALDAGREHADQRRDDEDAAQRHQQHDERGSPSRCRRPWCRCRGCASALPTTASPKPIGSLPSGAMWSSAMTAAATMMIDQRDDRQPADQRDRPGRHGLVELVAQPGSPASSRFFMSPVPPHYPQGRRVTPTQRRSRSLSLCLQ